jgi:1-acyl-sn-glycerol-3-phosphate acyltransferase
MTLTKWMVNGTIKGLTSVICNIDAQQLERVPSKGPLIIVANHINFLDVPVVVTRLQPRPITGFVKLETYDNPMMAFLFNIWDGIPIRRGEPDLTAIRRGMDALEEGKILAISPEGTRSNHGRLQKGHPGVVMMALLSGAPMLPIVYYGGEKYRRNLPRLKRTDFYIKVGRAFHIRPGSSRLNRQIRRKIADEIMYQLAALLPSDYRGEYADFSKATQTYIQFLS